MTTCHLVAHLQLALLGDVHLGQLDDAGRQLVAVGEVVLLAFHAGVELLVLDDVVVDGLPYEVVGVCVAHPFVRIEIQVVDLFEHLAAELHALAVELGAEIVLDTLRRLVLEDRPEFLHQDGFQSGGVFGELCVQLVELHLFGLFALLVVLVDTAEQLLVDHHAEERRLCLERCVLHVARLVAEDGTQQLLFRTRVALAFRGDLTDEDVARFDVRADADDTVVIEVLGSVLADVRNVGGELLHTAFGFAYLHDVLVHVHRREEVFAHETLRDHDGVLEVVPFPGHEGHLEVATQGQLAVVGRVTFGHDLSLLHLFALHDGGAKRDGHVLVGLAVTRQHVCGHLRIEADELLVFRTLVEHLDLLCVGEDHFAVLLRNDMDTAVAHHLRFESRTYDRGLGVDEGHGLAHHVRTHEGTVGVVVFEERDEAGRDGGDLVRRHVHEVHLLGIHRRIVGLHTRFDALRVEEVALFVDAGRSLRDDEVLLLFGAHVDDILVFHIHLAVLYAAIGRLDEAHVADLRIDAERGDQTDVRTLRGFDGAEAAVVGIVHVADLETCPVARQTARTEGRQTALVRHLGQRVDLVHELRELVRAEERVDDARERLGVDQVDRGEDLVVAHVHPFADGTRHPHETYRELVGELLSDGPYAAVAQVVNVVHVGLGVDERNEVLDNGDHVLFRQHPQLRIDVEFELLVDPETSHLAQVVPFVGEEQLVDHVPRRSLVGRLGVAQLPVYVNHRFLFGVAGVFL